MGRAFLFLPFHSLMRLNRCVCARARQHITFVEMIVNTFAQLLGAVIGAAVLDLAVGSVHDACNHVPPHMTAGPSPSC